MNSSDSKNPSLTKPHPPTGDMPEEIDNQEFETIFQNLQSTDDKVRIDAVTKVKLMLYANPNLELETTINRLISKGILDVLVNIINSTDDFDLKYQTIWTFVNICCGNSAQIGKVVEVGVVEVAVGLIEKAADGDPHDLNAFSLALESVWLLGNIAGDGLEHRDVCLEHEAVPKMSRLLKTFPHDAKLLENTVWTMQNLVSRKPAPFWNQISEALPLFQRVLEGYNTTGLQYHALWGICYISASYVKDVIQAGLVPVLIHYLSSDQVRLIFPALQALGNLISTTNDVNADEVLKHKDFLPMLFKLCSSSNQRIQIYATWAISNIAAGTPQQIAQIVETPEYIQTLSNQLSDPEDKIRYQASCALANLAFRATIEQLELLVTRHKYLDALLEVMKQDQPRIYERNIMEPINRIVTLDTSHKLKPVFKSMGLVEQMKNISNNMSYEMRTLANEIITKHFTNVPAPQPAALNPSPTHNVPAVGNVVPDKSAVAEKSKGKEDKEVDDKHKAKKPHSRKKIVKLTTKDDAEDKKKKIIKRTKTIMQTIEEANKFTKGMKKGGRTKKSSKPGQKPLVPKKKKEEETPKKGKLRRTNTMKQTLSEAKKILKQLDVQNKKKK